MSRRLKRNWLVTVLSAAVVGVMVLPGITRAAPGHSAAHARPHAVTAANQLAFSWPSDAHVLAQSGTQVADLATLTQNTSPPGWGYYHSKTFVTSGARGAWLQTASIQLQSSRTAAANWPIYHVQYLGTFYDTPAQATAMEQDSVDTVAGYGWSWHPCSDRIRVDGQTYYWTWNISLNPLPSCQFAYFLETDDTGGYVVQIYTVFRQGNADGELQFEVPYLDLAEEDTIGDDFRAEYANDQPKITDRAQATLYAAATAGGGNPPPTNTPTTSGGGNPTATPRPTNTPIPSPTPTNTSAPPPLIHISSLAVHEGSSQKATKTLHSGKASSFQVDVQYQNQGSFTPSATISLSPVGKVKGTSNISKPVTRTMQQIPAFNPNTWSFLDTEHFKVSKKEKVKADVKVTLGTASDEQSVTVTLCPKGKKSC